MVIVRISPWWLGVIILVVVLLLCAIDYRWLRSRIGRLARRHDEPVAGDTQPTKGQDGPPAER